MVARRLLASGIVQFDEYLLRLRGEPSLPVPSELLTERETSESTGAACELPPPPFTNRFVFAETVSECFDACDFVPDDRDVGLWSWLALHYFDELCPPDGNGRRKAQARPRYVLEAANWNRYYRHLVAAPYRIYRSNRDNPRRALALLVGHLQTPGELYEQIAARIELVSNPNFIEMVTGLYYDPLHRRLKRGAGGSSGGSPRRLAQVSQQFDLTFDFYSLAPSEIAALLPPEFERFKR